MSETPAWFVGQEVILRTPGSRYVEQKDEPAVVTRIGRKYVYIERNGSGMEYERWGRPTMFDKETGREHGVRNGAQRIGTPEMFAERDRREAAADRLSKLTRDYEWMTSLSTDTLTQIADLIEGGESR